MTITQKQNQQVKQIYLKKYNENISDKEAVDILTRLVNILNIIYDNE